MFLLYKPNFTADQVVAQVQDEFAKLQNAPIDAQELERAKTQLRATMIKQLQSSLSRAQQLGQYELADGDAALINTEFEKLLNVSAAQIQAAAKKYLTPDKRTVLAIQPAPAAKSTKGGK
jgi:predicted Zn-dependent peptidase